MKKLIAGILSAAMTLGCIALPAEVTDKIGSGSVIEASAETYGSFEYTVLDDGTVKITGYSGTHSILNIPAVISSKQVTVLGDNAFDNSSFTELYIPNGIKSIGKSTFANCDSIKSVTIPGSVESIGEYAFESCDALETVTISEGVTELGNYAFNWCKKLSSVTLPDSLRRIKGAKAFYNTDIVNNQTTPVKYVEKWAVQCDSGLTSASVNGAVGIADSLFSPSKKTLKKVIIFEGVKYIGYFAFSGCEVLTDVTLPDGLESICGAFYECTALESVTLPDGLKSMDNAFSNCSSLTSVYIPDGITEIGDFAFFRCYKLKTVNIPESVTVIGESAFNDCNVLSSITLPDKLETIEDKAFANCTSLKSITIPKSVKNLSESFNPIGYFGQIDYIKFSGFKIYCYSGTSGEQYAKENGFDYEVLDHTHSYTSKITKAATCTATGVRTYTCSCGDTYTQTIAKTAHTYKTTVVAPTYAAQGYTLHKCSGCGASYKDTYTAKKTVPTVTAKTTYTYTTNAVRINWNKLSGVTGYKIYRYNPTTKQWTALKAIYDPNVLTYKDSNLKSGTVYKYKVKAFVKSGGKFYFGNSCSTITAATMPSTATITKTAKSSTAVRLYWKKVTCTGYKIQRYNATTKKWVDVKTVSSATTNYRISGLKKNTSYKFRVCAYKNDGKKNLLGAWSYVTVKTTK